MAKARQRCSRALALFERHSGRRHPDVANILLELASISPEQGRYAAGLACVRRALAIVATLRGELDFDRLRVQALAQLGSLRIARGEYERAEAPCVRALAIARKRLTADDVASAMNGLAIVYKYTARFNEAGRLYRRALAILSRTHGPRDPAVASIFHNLGGLEHARGRFARAEPYARQSVAIRQRALGPDHPTVAVDVAAYAAILQGLGKHALAEKAYRRALAIFTRTMGQGHVEVAFNTGQLAALCHVRGRPSEASRHYAKAVALQDEGVRPAPPSARSHPVEPRRAAAERGSVRPRSQDLPPRLDDLSDGVRRPTPRCEALRRASRRDGRGSSTLT